MIKDYVYFAFLNFSARKLRTFLTVLGIIIGIAAVVGLISIGEGLQETINEQFRALGGDKLIVTPKGGGFAIGAPSGSADLTKDDLDVVRKSRGMDKAGGMIFKLGQVTYGDERKTPFVSGIPQDETKDIFSDIQTFSIVEGRDLMDGDKYSAVVGILLYEGEYFDKSVKIRDRLTIEGQEFKVVGVLGRIGNPQDDSQILIPLEAAREIFDEPEKLDFIMGQVRPGFTPSDVADSVTRDLRKFRDVDEDEEDFDVQTFEQILETFSDIFSVVQAILIGIAAISLLVGGIGIMNTMYTSVLQRTNEIGLMKSIGARNSDIALLFVIESGFLGLAGGIIGLIIGASMGLLVEFGASQVGLPFNTHLSFTLLVGSLLFSFVTGAVAGVAPAISASKLKPVEALRYE
ncbi:FtsX-like permease family protein [Candidatus Woesearchaeota archaeon]|nr:FtsX-like permease family protein [Candidatus Woesearchaeota archaeon]